MTAANPVRPHAPAWVMPLDDASCWARLAGGSEGRLRVRTGSGERSVVTLYRPLLLGAVMGVTLALPSYGDAFQHAIGRRVTLEVDGHDEDGGPWVVRITGVARAAADSSQLDDWSERIGLVGRQRNLYLPAEHVGGSVAHPCGDLSARGELSDQQPRGQDD